MQSKAETERVKIFPNGNLRFGILPPNIAHHSTARVLVDYIH